MEKQQVMYIHGGESFVNQADFLERLRTQQVWGLPSDKPYKKWTGKLAADLGEHYEVFLPAMPNKQNASYTEWSTWFERHFEHFHDGIILMGCSLGAMFLTKYFSENDVPFTVKALVIMACPIQTGDFNDQDCRDFVSDVSDLPKLAGKAAHIILMHSKDDFLVPYEHALEYKAALPEAELVTFTDKNHFLVEELPELVERIRAIT
jgi:predicted alpha/beta hydrolase family esterase